MDQNNFDISDLKIKLEILKEWKKSLSVNSQM